MSPKLLPNVLQNGEIDALALARILRLTKSELAELVGVGRRALSGKPLGPKARQALTPTIQILAAASEMSGSQHDAVIWFKYTPIISMGMKTAEQHVRNGICHRAYSSRRRFKRRLRLIYRDGLHDICRS